MPLEKGKAFDGSTPNSKLTSIDQFYESKDPKY